MNLIQNSRFEIFDGFGQDGSIIKTAATTCYRSEDTTKRDTNGFIKMLKSNKHLAMLEFMWISFSIQKDFNEDLVREVFISAKFLNFQEFSFEFKVSGNARAWFEFVDEYLEYQDKICFPKYMDIRSDIYFSLIIALKNINPVIFDWLIGLPDFNEIDIEINDIFDDYSNWVAVKLFDVSRGLTHELVRHRVMSFAQASTRYINMESFNFVFPERFLNPITTEWSGKVKQDLENAIESCKKAYQTMITCGLSKNEARQILPNGIANEICVAGCIKDWKHFFNLRTAPGVHWEIKELAINLQNEFIKRGLLNDNN